MKYRRLGNSGLKISEIGLGSWLTYGGTVQDAVAESCIDKAYELGVNFFDTANVYRRGEAEVVVGKALKKYARESYVLATKAFWPMGDGPNDRGLSRKHIFEQVHASLRRLDVEYIDLWQCHRYDPETPLEETLRAIDDLITQGKILYAGVSEWSAVNIREALHIAEVKNLDRIISNQPQYSMLQRYIEKDVLPLCKREGIGQVVWSPLAQGVLTGKYKKGEPFPAGSRATDDETRRLMGRLLKDENLDKVERLSRIAQEKDCTIAQLALAWVLREPNVASVIIGASRPDQVEENVKAIDVELTADDIDRIEQILQG
ncbi:voltage-dependent potassium channel beta subunit [Aneurinibacillus soli]|uniref:L-glyceraldehyde 3-phosphate reductase n=1 Tax=Aneurinibacillus soli TaxID=1500254 RepID=A0A0U4WH69_9BACL|nr:aldo/keto reductase family protein [Aneurinibacillus soli]PYE64076.1 voltage-dependent potassium channel beta subunit [Aneurinibacillus soli]BAU28025.1 L-glyceraldehyde 3-phosphate reductase [Aneurinibacillus soli]